MIHADAFLQTIADAGAQALASSPHLARLAFLSAGSVSINTVGARALEKRFGQRFSFERV